MPSNFPDTSIDSHATLTDNVSTFHADDVNGAWDAAIAAQTKLGTNADGISATSVEGRVKAQEAGALRRHTAIASAATITLSDDAQVFPITGTTAISNIAPPTYPRLVYLEFAAALTLVNGTGNLTLPSGADLAIHAGTVLALEWTGTTWRVAGGGGDAPPVDPVAATPGLRTLGTGSQQAAAGNDGRLSDPRSPLPHAGSHVTVGQDPLPLFTATTRGLVPAPGGTPAGVKALYDDAVWRDPALASGGMSNPMTAAGQLIRGSGTGPGEPEAFGPGTDGQVVGVDPTTHQLTFLDLASTVPSHDHHGTGDGGALDGPVVDDYIDFVQGGTTTPAADHGRLHAGLVSGILHPFWMDETGADVDLLTTGGGGGGGGGGGAEPGVAPQVAPPNAASWTLVNPIGTTPNDTRVVDGVDGVVHLLVRGSTGTNAQLAVKALPATPYVIKARLRMNLRGLNNSLGGICFYSTGDGKITAICIQNTTAPTVLSEAQYSSVNAYAGENATEGQAQHAVRDIWFKITDDGSAHRTYSYNFDGNDATWIKLSDVAHTHYHTPNRAGFFGDPQSVNRDVFVTLVSWEES